MPLRELDRMRPTKLHLFWVIALVLIVGLGLFWSQTEQRQGQLLVNTSPAVFGNRSSHEDPPVVNPTAYSSKSKVYLLRVNPTDRHGRGGAAYEMTRNGDRSWTADLPFTLQGVVVTDAGETVGYSYSHGEEGFGVGKGKGDFRIVILDPTGAPRLNEATDRKPSQFLHSAPSPIAEDVIVNEENDRVIFWIADADRNRRSDFFWTYVLSTGKPSGHMQPREKMKLASSNSSLMNARVVKGTPLILLQWWRFEYPDPQGSERPNIGAHYTLVDKECVPVWELDLPRDYVIPGNESQQDQLMNHVKEHGAIVSTENKNSFDLYLAARSQRVTFRVVNQSGVWKIEEISAEPLSIEEFARKETIPTENVELKPIKSLGQIKLETQATESPIRDLMKFSFDDRGRIGFIRRDPTSDTFLLVDDTGKVICEIPLVIESEEESSWGACSWISGDRFLLTRAGYGPEEMSRAWWVDTKERTVTQLKDFDSPPVERLIRFSDGGFVALTTMRYKNTMTHGLFGFDSNGRQIWKIDTDSSDGPTELFSPEDMTVTPDDQVAVIDNIQNTLQIFNRSGKFIRNINLEEKWGREPNYLSGIAATEDGFLIHDFNGKPPYVLTKVDGSVEGDFTMKLASGRLLDESRYSIAPNRRIWATDSEALFRINDAGVVDRILGNAPDDKGLAKIAGSTVDQAGRLYVVDGRSAKILSFDSNGAQTGEYAPKVEDFRGALFDTSIAVSNSGSIMLYVGGPVSLGRFVEFDSSGKQISSIKLQLSTDKLYYQPGTNKMLAITYETAVLLGTDGAVIQEITRRPDDKWLVRPTRACFAPDGSFAVLDSNSVSIYRADCKPVLTIALPQIVGGYPRLAFSGDRVVLSGEGNVLFYNSEGELIQASELNLPDKHFQPHIIVDGKELLIVPSKGTTLHRFEMP